MTSSPQHGALAIEAHVADTRGAGNAVHSEATSLDLPDLAMTLISTRQTVLPKRLQAPGPDALQVEALFHAAAAAPDHGQIRPWRFVLVAPERRPALADAFALALQTRDALATPEQVAQAREKAFRAPFVALAIARLGPAEPDIDPLERLVSLGAALQNMLLCAHAMGFAASLTSGQAMRSQALRDLLLLQPQEQAVCCLNVGTATRARAARPRPVPADFVSCL